MKRYCKIISCQNSLGTDDKSIHMFRIPKEDIRQQQWYKSLENIQCTGGNLICIEHFTKECFEIKSNKYVLKNSALPTIFPTPKNVPAEKTSTELHATHTINLENAGLEREKESTEIQLQKIISKQLDEIQILKEKVSDLEEVNSKYQTDFVAFAVNDNEEIQKQKEILSCLALGIRHRESYSQNVRNFAITLKNTSPAAYRYIRSEFNNHLPHSITIVDWHANSDINCEHGIMDHSLNILRRRVAEMTENGQKLCGALLFDEVGIRQHIQFVNDQMLGFENFPGMDPKTADVACESLVFMFSACNNNIRLPIAYYFVNKTMDAPTKVLLIEKVIEKIFECGVEVESIVFDGLRTNPAMCTLLGSNLDVFSNDFNASFQLKGKVIRILFDFSHVIKLVRNNLALKKVFFNADGNKIKWYYFEKLVHFKDKRNFALCHKLTQAHIDYSANPMKVKLAVETLSASTARAMEFLMNQGHPEFFGAEATIKFIRMINDLFDVFNSNNDNKENPLKNPMSPINAQQIFELFNDGSEYLKSLQLLENGKKIQLCKSSVKTGFQGFVVNIQSLTQIYNKLIVNEKAMKKIATHTMSQDHLEILFGKIRSLCGSNNNPTCQQFTASMRKIMANTAILYSKSGNCTDLGPVFAYNPYTNISHVSSRRPSKKSAVDTYTIEDIQKFRDDEEVEALNKQLADIQRLESNNLTDLSNLTVAHISGIIEWKILNSDRLNCEECKSVLITATKLRQAFLASTNTTRPCQSTFEICTVADHFLKIEILKGQFSKTTIERAIISSLDFENLYSDADFSQHRDHKLYLIKYILKEYVRIKGIHLARTHNFKTNQKMMRQKLTKLILQYHQ